MSPDQQHVDVSLWFALEGHLDPDKMTSPQKQLADTVLLPLFAGYPVDSKYIRF
jgi:hypothetical protein